MSKRSKKNRRAKQSIPSQAPQRATPRWAVMGLAIVVALSVGIWWRNYKSADISAIKPAILANPAHTAASTSRPEFQKLIGRWQRPDGGYVFEVKSVAADGAMEAAYFNPKSIRVAKAE